MHPLFPPRPATGPNPAYTPDPTQPFRIESRGVSHALSTTDICEALRILRAAYPVGAKLFRGDVQLASRAPAMNPPIQFRGTASYIHRRPRAQLRGAA